MIQKTASMTAGSLQYYATFHPDLMRKVMFHGTMDGWGMQRAPRLARRRLLTE